MNPWTGRPPRIRCRAHRSRRPTRACCWAGHPRPARGATAIRSAIATSPASARSAPRAAGNSPATASRTRPGESSPPRATMPCWSCTRSPATATCAGSAGPGHPTEGWWHEIVGPGARDRHRHLVRHRAQHARRLPGFDGTLEHRAGRLRVGVALPVPHDPRPGRRAGAAGRCPRNRRVGGGHRRLDGRHARPGVGRRLSRARRARRRPVGPAGQHRRPDRAQLGAARGDPHRSALPGRRVLRLRRRRRAASRTRARSPHGPAELPHRRPS